VSLPEARSGLVFRYEYVWKRQALAGRSVGEKERPACVVLSVLGAAGERRVLIVPITTQPPGDRVPSVEIPDAVRIHLGLDRQSWILLSEANIDTWPSPDMRPIPGRPGDFAHGLLPLKLVNRLCDAISKALAAKHILLVKRDEG